MALEQLQSLKNRMEELRKSVEAESKQAFSATANEIFAKHPTLERFSWRQYTPYFNDGDECTFSAHIDPDAVSINGEDGDDVSRTSKWNGAGFDDLPADKIHPLNAAQKEVCALLIAIGEDFLKAMFGDHCEVNAKRDGTVTVESYSHD